jgi:hypothetical protein
MRTHLIYVSIIIAMLAAIIFVFRGGCNEPVSNTLEFKELEKKNAEYGAVIKLKTDTINQLTKKYDQDSERSSEIIKSLTIEKDQLSDITGKLKTSVTDLTGLYRKARSEADTAVALLLADNQSNMCDAYVWQSQRELFVADSLINAQRKDINSKNAYIQKQIQFRNEFMAIAAAKDAAYERRLQIVTKENKRLNNWWNRWGEKVVVGVGAAAIGYSVGQIAK